MSTTKELFESGNVIKALSWKNPYAELMLHGKIETRTWDTKYRGLVLICASQKPFSEMDLIGISGQVMAQQIFKQMIMETIHERNGMAIAIGILSETRPMEYQDEANTYVKYSPGKFCHIYKDVVPIEPFIWKGSQGWKLLTREQRELIKFL